MPTSPETINIDVSKIESTLGDSLSVNFFTYVFSSPKLINELVGQDPVKSHYRIRGLQMVAEYITNPNATYKSIAQQYDSPYGGKLSRERVRQLISEEKARMHRYCLLEIQKKYPLSNISFALAEPAKVEEVVKVPDPKAEEFYRLYKQRKKLQEKLSNFDGNLSDPDIQALLDQVDRAFYNGNALGREVESPLLIAPKTLLLRETGYFVYPLTMPYFYQTIQQAGIPMGSFENTVSSGIKEGLTQRYFFVWIAHKDRALQAWEANPALDRFKVSANPVKILRQGTWNEPMPTPKELKDESRFLPVDRLIEALGINEDLADRLKIEGLFYRNNNLPVFYRKRAGSYYLVGQEEELKQYIRDFVQSVNTLN